MFDRLKGTLGDGAVRGGAVYAAATAFPRGMSLLLLPLYVRALAPAEYGQLAVIVTLSAALGTMLSFGLETAVFRSYMRLAGSPVEQHRFVNSIGLFSMLVPPGIAAVLGAVTWAAARDLVAIPGDALAIGLLGTGVQVSATIFPMAVLRAQERLSPYLKANLVFGVTNSGLTFLAVVVFHMGVAGWFAAALASYLLLLFVGLNAIGHRWSRSLDTRMLAGALAFGLPMVPHAFAHWGLTLSDRIILGAFRDSSEIGVYNVAYQFAMPIGVLVAAMNQGIMPMYVRASTNDTGVRSLARLVTHQAVITSLLGLAVALLAPSIIDLALPPDYSAASDLVVWIALGYTLYGLYLIPMDTLVLVSGRTRWIWVGTAIAAATNVGLNLAFVPEGGAVAAAVNTAVAYAVLVTVITVYMIMTTEKRLAYDWIRIGQRSGLVLLAYVTTVGLLPNDGRPLTLLLRGLVVLAVGAVLLGTLHTPAVLGFTSGRRRPRL